LKQLKQCLAVAGSVAVLVGCATIVKGTDQTLTVTTTPSGAICELKRGGQTMSVVNPTPGSVLIEKSKDDISVICSKEDHQDGGAALTSKTQGMTFGNILFGGIIGVAIDAGSGAMNKYPASVHVTLIPNGFSSTNSRDEFFDTENARITREAAEAISQVREKCNPNLTEQCDKTVAAIQEERDSQIAEMELKRAQAKIAGE